MKPFQDQILDFNNDFQVQSLRAKYNRPTFFELMAKGRSETVHSSFLSWLLQGDELNQQDINLPIISFLGILVRRDAQQNNLVPISLKKAIITRSIKIDSVKTSCEFPVKKLASKKLASKKLSQTSDSEDIQKIAEKSKDRIDLVIDCNIQEVGNYKKLQIIIENKVSSTEGSSKKDSKTGCKNYDSLDQTSRYFMGASCDDGETFQFFVYLTPLASQKLDDYSNLSDTQKCGKSDKYIQINYQDIADCVLVPLIRSANISDRARMLLEEYMETLTIPALANSDEDNANDVKKMLVMASKEEDRNQLLDFLNKYQDLIVYSVLIANPSIELENYGNCKNIIEKETSNSYAIEGFAKRNIRFSTAAPGKKRTKIEKPFEEFFQDDNVYDLALLYDFYKQNSRLIVAAMKILVESSNASADLTLWQDLYDGLTTNVDRTKYIVTIGNTKSKEPLNKRGVVKYIVQNIPLEDNLIEALNKAIPRMFLKFNNGENQEFDRSRYEGLKLKKDENFYECCPLKGNTLYSLYVSNQWGVLPLSENEKKDKESHPSGKGGNFGKLLDFFLNKDYGVTIEEAK